MSVKNASAVLVVDGRYAMQLRDGNAPTWPNCWGLFGGRIEPGESSYQALVRELREELELDVTGARHLADLGPVRVFLADVGTQWARHVLHEGTAARLFSYGEVMRLDGLSGITQAALAAAERHRLAAGRAHAACPGHCGALECSAFGCVQSCRRAA